MSPTDFATERATLARVREVLLPEHEGRFVVIIGVDVIATTCTLDEALDAGFRRAGGPGFFTSRLTAVPDVSFVRAVVVQAG